MTICHKRKLIFVHIPKNAGTSIHSLFNTNPKDYLPDQKWTEYKNHFREYWENYTRFSIVREPISRFISIYKYCKMQNIINFSNIENFIDNIGEVKTPIKNLQSWFVCENETIMLDNIIKYENLNQEIKSIGLDMIPHKNKSYLNEEITLTKNATLKIKEFYQKDFEIFNY